MTIVAQEEEIKYITVDGKKVLKYKPRVELTIKHLESGREYLSEKEEIKLRSDPVILFQINQVFTLKCNKI